METEQQVQKKIITLLETEFNAWATVNMTNSKAGIPDITACVESRLVAVEVKLPTTMHTVSKLQQYNIDKIVDAGGIAFASSSVEHVRSVLHSYKLGNPPTIEI